VTGIQFNDGQLLAGLDAAVESGRSFAFAPEGIDTNELAALLDEMVVRGWITRKPALTGHGRLTDPPRTIPLLDKGVAARSMLADPRHANGAESGVPVADERAIWAALMSNAVPAEAATAAEAAWGSIVAAGLEQTQLSVRAAARCAAGHHLSWVSDDQAFRTVLPAPTLTDSQHVLVRAAAWHFRDNGVWPDTSQLVRSLARAKQNTTVRDDLLELPGDVGFERSETVVVSSEGFALAGECDDLLGILLAFVELGHAKFIGDDDEPVITSDELLPRFGQPLVERLAAMLDTETFLTHGWHGADGGWEWTIGEAILHFDSCDSTDDYLRIRRAILGRRYEQPHANPDESAPIGRLPARSDAVISIGGLHERISAVVADQLLSGRPQDAVIEASKEISALLRDRTGLANDGTALAEEAGSLLDYGRGSLPRTTRNINRGTQMMLEGFMLAVRNPTAHERGLYSRAESAEVVALASLLARLIDEAEMAPQPPNQDLQT
jgi:uncharacterized protein (TIGR02391 family)